MIVLNYPHLQPSLEPKRLRKEEIWLLGETARLQTCGTSPRLKVEVSRIIARAARLRVNGLAFETHWELNHAVVDDEGTPVLGAVEYDEAWPTGAMIYLNGEVIGERDGLARSTAVHELAHAIFDMPAWLMRAQGSTLETTRRFQAVHADAQMVYADPRAEPPIDWGEWRANEFMGSFLAPRRLLHRHMHKRAAARGIALVEGPNSADLPIVCPHADGSAVTELTYELAEMFGVSDSFMHVRLRKYGLIGDQLHTMFVF